MTCNNYFFDMKTTEILINPWPIINEKNNIMYIRLYQEISNFYRVISKHVRKCCVPLNQKNIKKNIKSHAFINNMIS